MSHYGGGAVNGGGCALVGGGDIYMGNSVASPEFCRDPKTALEKKKKKAFLKKSSFREK